MPAESFEQGRSRCGFDQVRLIPERIEKRFQQLEHRLFHTLRIASDARPMRHTPQVTQTRVVPCAWGVRWDEYRSNNPSGGPDDTAFRAAAADAAAFLLRHPLAAWNDLLPGTMTDVMCRRSKLYLADYWTLTLHHLVWSKKLPYVIRADWLEGDSVKDEAFYFVSELPVSLAEASLDALILFQEAAVKSLEHRFELASATPIDGPPTYRSGRWRLPVRCPEKSSELDSPASSAESLDRTDASKEVDDDAAAPPTSESSVLELDDQSFTVCCGNATFRFTGRNKQLFALLERISRRPGFRVTFDDLRSVGDVWDGSPVEDSTIRGAVTRLRKALKQHELTDVADRITTGTYRGSRYVMLKTEASGK